MKIYKITDASEYIGVSINTKSSHKEAYFLLIKGEGKDVKFYSDDPSAVAGIALLALHNRLDEELKKTAEKTYTLDELLGEEGEKNV